MTIKSRRTHLHRKRIAPQDRAKAEAHQLLDRARAGHPIETIEIVRALRITGDLT